MKPLTDSGTTRREMPRERWQKPSIRTVGSVNDVLQGGGGKLSSSGGDPGETRKESPSG